ncbi:rab GTPase-binding effector protein 1-like [Sinocyclocheilus grahami]|uniref:rab GTPase-binding effector protein 1-like n=1 Tax=Sinocyclocheilus grahami TaxID=75366 RepID=UPI0007AC62EC|nr:PREDICTED: rab GTPase-binding effector protein 1-like [Sinocyclocheilus grahami]
MSEQASGPTQPPQQDGVLQQRAAEQEQDRADFLQLKQQLEMEFNQKRAKFKELYLSKEEELKRQAAVLEKAQAELSSVQTQLEEAKAEMETIKAVATVSESTKQEAIDQVKQQWQEEVASLQAIMKDAEREVKLQFQQKLEQERAHWTQYRDGMEREVAELRRRLSEGQEEENLENDMKKAQEDAEKLRSVVMPMESEIAALKAKLSSSEDRVKELEAAKVKELNHVLKAEKSCRTDLEMYVAVLNTQKSVLQEDAEKLRKELHEEELKRQAAVLEKAQAELSSVQTQLEEAKAEMETIKAVATVSESTKQEAIDQVKQQWQEEVASLQAIMKDAEREVKLQFQQKLEQERAHWTQYRDGMEREVAELRRRLSEGQEEENLENDMKKAQEDAEKLRSVVMPMESEIAALKAKLSSSEDRVKELEAAKVKELNHVLKAEKSCRTDLEMYVAVLNTQKSVLQEDAEKLRKELHEVQEEDEKERLSQAKEASEDDGTEHAEAVEDFLFGLSIEESHLSQSIHSSLHSLDADTPGRPDGSDPYKDGLRRVQSTDSLGSSGGALQPHGLGGHNNKAKSASQLDESDFGPLVGADCGGFDSRDTSSISSLQPGHFLLTKDQEKAIKAMTPEQEETASLLSSISHTADTAYLPPSGYRLVSESEWNLLQQQLKNAGRKLGRRCDMCSNYEKQLQVIQGQEAETRDQVKKLQAMLRQSNDQLERMMNERQELEDSVKQANEETTAKELQKLVLQYREDIISAHTAAEHLEEKLKAEILFLKEQIQAEQCLKENLEDTLQLEIEGCKEEIASFSSLKTELERVKSEKEQLESSLAEKSQMLESVQGLKNRLEEQLKDALGSKSALETQVFEEKDKAQRLQTELDVSEQVQRDFVKLSQTLQVNTFH